MSAAAHHRRAFSSSLSVNLLRYRRSTMLWLMLLAAPVAARYMISNEQGEGIVIAVGRQMPILTSAVLGVWLGIVVSTILMPIAYIYLRANTTRRQPWQVEEVTAASRVAIALGRFGADCAVLAAILAALSIAGLFLGAMIVAGPWRPFQIIVPLWLIAAPTLAVVAAIRIVFDAVPALRGALGDVCFFLIWTATLVIGALFAETPSSLATNMADMAGYVRPLIEGAPAGSEGFAIGSTAIEPGRIALDVMQGLTAQGYLASRLIWAGMAVGIVLFAGLVYRPHRQAAHKKRAAWIERLSVKRTPQRPERASSGPSERAAQAGHSFAGLIVCEARLIASGTLFWPLAAVATFAGLFGDYRHIGSPAALLLLVFALSAHAGRSEARNLVALTQTMALPPYLRRIAFVAAGTCLALAMSLPAALIGLSGAPIMIAMTTGFVGALDAILLAWAAKSPAIARIVLIIVWYGYLSS